MNNTKLRQERINRGWTLAFVAQHIGLTPTAIHDIEKSKQRPSYDVLVKLEDLFQKSHRYLLSQVENTIHDDYNNSEGGEAIETNAREASLVAAAQLSEVPASVMVAASLDLRDGRADTAEGRRVLELMRQTGGSALINA